MSKNNNKIEYHIVKTSAQQFSLDLAEFSKEINDCSDEQLHVIFSYFDNIKFHVLKLREEFAKRSGKY